MKFMEIRESTEIKTASPQAVAEAMKDESRIDRECFWVIHLDTKNSVIEKELVSMGTLDRTVVHPRETFRRAIVNSAAGIITVHNHPSGDTMPSKEDAICGKH